MWGAGGGGGGGGGAGVHTYIHALFDLITSHIPISPQSSNFISNEYPQHMLL